ncbi:MAG: 2-oxo acid dehydrogenase subunit E2 [Alphaproteobacteria bacterium]|nr:2-oxo acid dehydrogenase subunit E2 [Alphaproteobacteria bacterium]
MGEFRMPSLGADMEDGTLVEWRVKVGDTVSRGDIVAVVETQKGAIEIEVFESGTVLSIEVPEDEKVPVGAVLARIGNVETSQPASEAKATPPPQETEVRGAPPANPSTPPQAPKPVGGEGGQRRTSERGRESGETEADAKPSEEGSVMEPDERSGVGPPRSREGVGADAGETKTLEAGSPKQPPSKQPPSKQPPSIPTHAPRPPIGWVRSSPSARRRAHELDLDLTWVPGTGPHGAVTRKDVERAARSAKPAAEAPVDAMRQAIAAAMSRSNREIPHYHLAHTVDLAAATAWLARRNADVPVDRRLVPAALLIKATALALKRHGALNGTWVDDRFHPADGVHPGIAISLRGGGLVIPAIRDADTLDLDALMQALTDLVDRARRGRLRGSELSSPTFTLTNLGERGVELVHGVIYPPQVALVGVGAVVERPWAVDGMLTVRPVVTLTLAGDHRASDGHTGAAFLRRIDRLLQRPEAL